MRLYYHPESDCLFWSYEWPGDGYSEDVTHDLGMRAKAQTLCLVPPEAEPYDYDEEMNPGSVGDLSALREFIARGGRVTRDTAKFAARDPNATNGGMAGAIVKSYTAWDRKPADFYPTPFDVTESLVPLIERLLEPGARIWEPACGDLDMTRVLEWHGFEVTSTDIRDTGIISPENNGFGGLDFLNDDPAEKFGWEPDPDMVVMNPPFALAAEFIEKALTYTPNVACLMKIDYWNAISRLPLWQRQMPAFFLPLTWRPAFLAKERGNSPLMNCAWCVWIDPELRDLGTDICVIEPLRKRSYPGYHGTGIRTEMSRLVQALDDLAEVISNVRTNA